MKQVTKFSTRFLLGALFSFAIIVSAGAAENYNTTQKYVFDQTHTQVTWHANHFGFSTPNGKFTDVSGDITLNEKNPEKSSVNVVIKTAKIDTGIEKFDEHLKSKDFFNVEKFPEAKFTSKTVEVTGKDTAKVTGSLTLLGVTKDVVLDTKLNKIGENPFTKKKTAGFSATTTIKRSDFGMSYGVPGVADDITLTIEAEATI